MKHILYPIMICCIIIYACSTTKKSTTVAPLVATSLEPGDKELTAIQATYPDVTAKTLAEGYSIYTGPCTKCHGQMDLFKRSESSWKHEVDDMSPKAKLTSDQKDALWKYILAMRAARPASTK